MSLQNPLGRVRGLGSAKEGVHHWWMQRLTAVALVPLTLWFVVSLIVMTGSSQADVREWISSPLPAVLLICTIIAAFHHGQLGLQVVIEDYVHNETLKMVSLLAVKGGAFLCGLLGVFCVLKIAFGG